MDPFIIIIPVVFLMLVLIFLNNQYSSIEIIIFLFFIITTVILGIQYFYGTNLTASIKQLFSDAKLDIAIVNTDKTENTIKEPPKTNLDTTNQTFHVQGEFDYMNAKALCKAYNGKLANIQQVTDAYDKGAEWCDYGWSEDNMVLYPTQYNTWKSYQELGNKEQCGRPGVNGGYNSNLLQKLGVNCFGKKPNLVGEMPTKPIQQGVIDERVEYWQKKLTELKVSPFNYDSWSQ
jgi:hypothetical protein